MYCENRVNLKQFLLGADAEVEHIIPRSILFDDSFSNKVCSCRACNKEKNNRTAYAVISTSCTLFRFYIKPQRWALFVLIFG